MKMKSQEASLTYSTPWKIITKHVQSVPCGQMGPIFFARLGHLREPSKVCANNTFVVESRNLVFPYWRHFNFIRYRLLATIRGVKTKIFQIKKILLASKVLYIGSISTSSW